MISRNADGPITGLQKQSKREQMKLKKKLVTEDCNKWGASGEDHFSALKLIGGVDLSFPKGDADHACACLVVLSFPELEVIYEDLSFVHLRSPYVPEYLAFREVEFLVDLISGLQKLTPALLPQVILVDGNGVLHPRGFGIACHLGVLTDIPTVGVAKTLFHVDGLEHNSQHTEQIVNYLKVSGDSFPLQGISGAVWGKVKLISCVNSKHFSGGKECPCLCWVKELKLKLLI